MTQERTLCHCEPFAGEAILAVSMDIWACFTGQYQANPSKEPPLLSRYKQGAHFDIKFGEKVSCFWRFLERFEYE